MFQRTKPCPMNAAAAASEPPPLIVCRSISPRTIDRAICDLDRLPITTASRAPLGCIFQFKGLRNSCLSGFSQSRLTIGLTRFDETEFLLVVLAGGLENLIHLRPRTMGDLPILVGGDMVRQ